MKRLDDPMDIFKFKLLLIHYTKCGEMYYIQHIRKDFNPRKLQYSGMLTWNIFCNKNTAVSHYFVKYSE